MTPRQINGITASHAFNVRKQAENADFLAWMIGHYTAIGLHNPKEYPQKPFMIRTQVQTPDMTPDEMQDRLKLFAEVNNAIEGAKP